MYRDIMADKEGSQEKKTLTLGAGSGASSGGRARQTVVIRRTASVRTKEKEEDGQKQEAEKGIKILEKARQLTEEKEKQRQQLQEKEEVRQKEQVKAQEKQKARNVKLAGSQTADPKPPAPSKPASKATSSPSSKKGKEDWDAFKEQKLSRDRNVAERRQGQRVLITHYDASGEEVGRQRSLASVRRAQQKQKRKMESKLQTESRRKVVQAVTIPDVIIVSELANRMAERVSEVVKALMSNGVFATANQSVDGDTAQIIAEEMGHTVKRVSDSDVLKVLRENKDETGLEKIRRGPVVTVMGHVDHGKTTLLDALRETDTLTKEFGGITQHVGAYQVVTKEGRPITFIDTPGHEAFSSMRARGAGVTDIVVLVVAADDSLKSQTLEAIKLANDAGVPIVVAINKVDLPGANIEKVKHDLLASNVILEEFSGDVQAVEISAKNRQNLEGLLEKILLQADMLDLDVVNETAAEGTVIEARMDKGWGPVMTILIGKGTLQIGDTFVVGGETGRVRSLIDSRGRQLKVAHPSDPVEVLGAEGVPRAGDDFDVVAEEGVARQVAQYRRSLQRAKMNVASQKTAMEKLQAHMDKVPDQKEINIIIKADVQGTAEALRTSFENLSGDQVLVRILHAAVGSVTESDVSLAQTSGALIFAFNVRILPGARKSARQGQIAVRFHSVIYSALDDFRSVMESLLSPVYEENPLGEAEVRKVFKASKIGSIAGCFVTSGLVRRGGSVRLYRKDDLIYEGKIKTLRRERDEVRDVRQTYECGIVFDNFHDFAEGDRIECFEMKQVAAILKQ